MSTVTRVHGTEVHTPATGEERIAAFRRIVERKSYAKIDGLTVDLFTASHVVQVYDAVNDANKAILRSKDTPHLIALVWAVLRKTK